MLSCPRATRVGRRSSATRTRTGIAPRWRRPGRGNADRHAGGARRWAVQARQEEVDAREVQVDKLVDEVWLREGVIDGAGVEAKACRIPTINSGELGERR
jgi:hypothetical protein